MCVVLALGGCEDSHNQFLSALCLLLTGEAAAMAALKGPQGFLSTSRLAQYSSECYSNTQISACI